jgi:hypothetical protein
MPSAVPSVSGGSAAAPVRRKFGVIAFVLAVVAFLLFSVGFTVFINVPSTAPDAMRDAALLFFVAIFLVITPLLELAGIVFGIASLFRAGDRKILGLLGAVLNAFLLAGGVTLGMIAVASIAAPG